MDNNDLSFQMQSVSVQKGFKFHIIKNYVNEYPLFFDGIILIKDDMVEGLFNKLKSEFPDGVDNDMSQGLGIRTFEHSTFVLCVISKCSEILVFVKNIGTGSKHISDILEPFVSNKNKLKIGIEYYYLSGKDISQHTVQASEEDMLNIRHDFYPRINLDILTKNFIQSTANILILMGVPGTGKTTLLKYIIAKSSEYKTGANSMNVYCKDKELLQLDQFWITLLKKDVKLLLLDDIDNMLYSREDSPDGNPFLSQLLSFSNGVFANNTKIIITTNKKIDDIDSALLRPGRCFDIINIDPLSESEATKIIQDAEIKLDITGEITQSDLIVRMEQAKQINSSSYIYEGNVSFREAYEQKRMKRKAGFST